MTLVAPANLETVRFLFGSFRFGLWFVSGFLAVLKTGSVNRFPVRFSAFLFFGGRSPTRKTCFWDSQKKEKTLAQAAFQGHPLLTFRLGGRLRLKDVWLNLESAVGLGYRDTYFGVSAALWVGDLNLWDIFLFWTPVCAGVAPIHCPKRSMLVLKSRLGRPCLAFPWTAVDPHRPS